VPGFAKATWWLKTLEWQISKERSGNAYKERGRTSWKGDFSECTLT